MWRLTRDLAAVLCATVLVPAACSSNTKPSAVTVDIVGDPAHGGAYRPEQLTVRRGTTVTWIERDTRLHTVTAEDNSFGSGFLGTDQRYTVRFNKPGTYRYKCTIHPLMTGEFIVQ